MAALLDDAARWPQAVHPGHLDVHEHDIGSSWRVSDGLVAVARFADDFDVVLGLEDHPEPGSNHRLVVDEHDADGHAAAPFSGKVA